ncbi:MAG: NTP transferase domain-containing protein [Candidatus Eiseniibacteriota bacterium]|jgi:bifunctional UDP-N-acetylglucosamine pyrophosphorylase/glucosamine-1-phosphate N-acetyltransferase
MEARAIAVILAAGEGKRMKSILPKVLHRLAGKPLVEYVVQTTLKADMLRTVVVVGHRRDMVITALDAYPLDFVVQEPQLGTGHAMQRVIEEVGHFGGAVVVLLGDAPFIRTETLKELVDTHHRDGNAITLLTAEIEEPRGYGRIVRGEDGSVERIVEEADATDDERAIREINSGIACYSYEPLVAALAELQRDNEQGEYYLTDTIALARDRGDRVGAMFASEAIETWGINDFQQLRAAERILIARQVAEGGIESEGADGAGHADGSGEALAAGGVAEDDPIYHGGMVGDDDDDDIDGDEGGGRAAGVRATTTARTAVADADDSGEDLDDGGDDGDNDDDGDDEDGSLSDDDLVDDDLAQDDLDDDDDDADLDDEESDESDESGESDETDDIDDSDTDDEDADDDEDDRFTRGRHATVPLTGDAASTAPAAGVWPT